MTRPGDNQRRIYRIEPPHDPELEAMFQRHERAARTTWRILAICAVVEFTVVALAAGLMLHGCLPALLAWVQR